ncbi:MAG: hypothetical protein KAJ19_05185, partial [Gammaproteobacteria bacterium]|nr:hypothetical protein [Gammaproteobacteria bacterium]
CYISDDARGRVYEYYIEFEYTAEQAVDRFGLNKVSDEIAKAFNTANMNSKKYPFFLYIGPRHDRNDTKQDNQSMPIEASWFDCKAVKLMAESGYPRMPAFSHRFYKRPHEPYGYSPAMMALMDVRYANTMAATEIISAMKQASPAWAVPDEAFLQPLSFNPDDINVYDSRNLTKDQIFTLGNKGDLNINEMMLEKRYEAIKEHMFYDVFLAFQGITKQMTVPEVMQRAQERMTLLGPAIGMLMGVLEDVVAVTLEKAFTAGRLPEMPDELKRNPNYEVEFTSTLALANKSANMQSLQTALAMVGEMAQFDPSALDKVDTDAAVDAVWEATGANPNVKRDQAEVVEIRQIRSQQQAEIDETTQLAANTQIAKTASEASKNLEGSA